MIKSLERIKNPMAITMWDSSWIRRCYKGGGFEDWDKALDELVERGYNAIRIDVFPHLVAKGVDGKLEENFISSPTGHNAWYGFSFWGNQWTITMNPRKALVEFIKKCEKRNIYLGISTWFKPTNEGRNASVEGLNEFVRVWDETLLFLEDNDCLNNVAYIDLLNEYPNGHGFWWLHEMLSTMRQPKEVGKVYNSQQRKFYRDFMDDAIIALKKRWGNLSFATSKLLYQAGPHDMDRDYSNFDFLDFHIWHSDCNFVNEDTGYFDLMFCHGMPEKLFSTQATNDYGPKTVITLPSDIHYADCHQKMLKKWEENKEQFKLWLEDRIADVAEIGKKYDIPIGNTEGWGPVNWFDHPSLDWTLIKECGELGAKLGSKYNYKFNCTSNMCEPQFLGMWEEIEWHQRMTKIIKTN